MTGVETAIAALEKSGWFVWHIGRGTRGEWSCRLFSSALGERSIGERGPAGYDLPCWRHGVGPTMLAAVSAAAGDLLQQPKEETVDLAALLR